MAISLELAMLQAEHFQPLSLNAVAVMILMASTEDHWLAQSVQEERLSGHPVHIGALMWQTTSQKRLGRLLAFTDFLAAWDIPLPRGPE
jgi:hypothetical protein